MKKITLLLMACCMSLMTFAAGGNITYVLNGGVTNPDGWTSKADMLVAFNQDYNTANSVATTATWYTWETLDVILAAADPVVRIPTFAASGFYVVLTSPKWQWLHDYIVATGQAQGIAAIAEEDNAYWRYETSAFFVNGKRASWPVSASYAVAGQPGAFIPAWKQAFAGPAIYDGSAEVIIPDPYRDGFSFDGWYEAADFSGTKVTSIPVGADGDKTLYAKWVDYVPTCLEIQALAVGASTKASGVVTFVDGNNVYIQDVTAGLLVEFAAAPSVVAGDKITVTGTTAALGTYKKVTGAVLGTKEASAIPASQTILLSALVADAASYIFEYVYLEGLKITANDGATATLSDDVSSIKLAVALAPSTYPVNSKVNVRVVVSYTDALTLVGNPINITLSPVPRPDGATYPVIDSKYQLTSKWMVSNVMDNLSANSIASAAEMVRGMVVKDGKMYFIDSRLEQLTVVDGATGAKLDPIKLDATLFANVSRPVAGLYPLNDLQKDAAGHILQGNLITSTVGHLQVWKLDLATGTGTIVIDEILANNPDFTRDYRVDAFGVYGDVDNNAIIMAQTDVMETFKWTITNGVATGAELIIIDAASGTFLEGLNGPGTAPRVFPMDENYWYLDGNATLPTLIDMEGNVVDGFFNVPAEVEVWSASHNVGHNGLAEFEMGGEYFFIMAYTNNTESPPSSFRLFKWKDANKEFKDIQALWTLPAAGMGTATNSYRVGLPAVEVDEATKTAKIYLYTGENGYGVYEFKIGTDVSIKPVKADAIDIFASGHKVTLSETAASVKVFNPMGQLLQNAKGVSSLEIPDGGVYIVSVQTLKGETVTKKVIIR